MIVSAIVIVGYTALGGFLAASTTDLIQSIVMTIALVIVLVFGVNVAGGMDAVMDNARSLPGYFSMNAHIMRLPLRQPSTAFYRKFQCSRGVSDISECHIYF